MNAIIFLFFQLLFNGDQTTHLQVIVTNVKLHHGNVIASVYVKRASFLKEALISKKIASDSMQLTFYFDLPQGNYAITIYQDINNNGKLDFGVFHIPKEPIGFGNNFKPRFSAPDFDDCKIALNKVDIKTEIKLY